MSSIMSDEQFQLRKQVQSLVFELLKDGASPRDVSFALGWVAADLGLEVTDGSIAVLLVLFAAVTDAIGKSLASSTDGDEEEDGNQSIQSQETAPLHTVIH